MCFLFPKTLLFSHIKESPLFPGWCGWHTHHAVSWNIFYSSKYCDWNVEDKSVFTNSHSLQSPQDNILLLEYEYFYLDIIQKTTDHLAQHFNVYYKSCRLFIYHAMCPSWLAPPSLIYTSINQIARIWCKELIGQVSGTWLAVYDYIMTSKRK